MTQRFLVFGKTGQVARELQALSPESIFLDRSQVDLTNAQACDDAILRADVEAVINAAAWTAVDGAEDDVSGAKAVNATAPGAMAKACRTKRIPFVTISTDYVFDGSGTTPFRPNDPTDPLGAYGRSKLSGEKAVRRAGGRSVILRTSWVFSAHGSNFVKTMLRLAETRNALSIVSDQIGGPTSAASIAETCLHIARSLIADPNGSGIHHLSGAPDVSWADFAREIFAMAGKDVFVTDIPTADYPTPAARPLNSRLDCTSLEKTFGISRPIWRDDLKDVLSDLGALP